MIASIKTGFDCKVNDYKRVLYLLNSANAFIACHHEVFNEPQTIYGILNVLNKNLKNIDKKDIFKKYCNEENENIFDTCYNEFLNINWRYDETNIKIDVYRSAIEKLEFFINCLGD